MAGGEDHIGRTVAAGERAADGGGCSEGGGDAGNNLKGHTGFGERGHLLCGAAEEERIAALEAYDNAPRLCQLDHQRVDLLLRDALHAAALAHVDDFGDRRGQCKNRLRNKAVVQNYIGGLKKAQSLDGEQVGISGTGADQIDLRA